MRQFKTVVFGYDELLLASLDFLSGTETTLSTVVFPSNRQDWRANKIREIVTERGFSVVEQPSAKSKEGFIAALRRIAPDLILVWSYPMILPREAVEIPRYGCVNVHLGLLPEYRGLNGVRWALLNGEDQTGVTLHFMDAGIDSGDMISRAAFPITPEDDIVSLMQKSKLAGHRLLEHSWSAIATGTVNAMPQDESKAKYYSAQMAPSDGIDWSKSNVQIHNLIRASAAPYAGAYTLWNGSKFVIRKTLVIDDPVTTKPGTIEKLDSEGIEVATGAGLLRLTSIECEGKGIAVSRLDEMDLKVGDKFQISIAGQAG